MRESLRRAGLSSRVVATLLMGLIAGMMQEEYFFLTVIVRDLTPEVWAQVQSNFRLLHPYTVVPAGVVSFMCLVFTLWLETSATGPRRWLMIAAAAMGVLIGLLTILVMVPLNDTIFSWTSQGLPADWTTTRDEWIGFQAVRAVVSTTLDRR